MRHSIFWHWIAAAVISRPIYELTLIGGVAGMVLGFTLMEIGLKVYADRRPPAAP